MRKKYPSVKVGNIEVGAPMPRVICNVSKISCAVEGLKQGAEIIEVRVDLIKPAHINAVENFFYNLRQKVGDSVPLLGTIRRSADCGGWYRFNKSEEERYKLFKRISPYINAIDIEYETSITQNVLEFASNSRLTTILSYHNFAYTPSKKDLEKMIQKMEKENSDILKVACMVCDSDDFDVLVEVLQEYVNIWGKKPITVISMGDHGRVGRYIFPWIGSCFTYGCVRKEKAPAQPFVHELVKSINLAKKVSSELPITPSHKGIKVLEELSQKIEQIPLYQYIA